MGTRSNWKCLNKEGWKIRTDKKNKRNNFVCGNQKSKKS
jgi:hypothetical protein